MTEKEMIKLANHLKQGGILEYGGMKLKAKHVVPPIGTSLCDICPMKDACSLPFSEVCALMEENKPYNWVLVKEDDV